MCALRQRAFPLPTGLRRSKNFAPASVFQINAFETYVCFFEKTEQGWKLEIPQIFDFEKSGFFIGGRANHRFHELIRFR